MNKDIFDFYFPSPATFGDVYNKKPPMNGGGSPSPPPAPPPSPAPFRSDSSQGEQALTVSSRRKGLRKTILAQQLQEEKQTLGVSNNLNTKVNTALAGGLQ